MIWFFHSNGTETSISRASRASANSAPVNIAAAARRKIPSNRGFSISNPNQRMTWHDHEPCCGDVRARHSRLQLDRWLEPRGQQARNKMSIVDVKRFYQQINPSGRDERASPWRGRDWMNAEFGAKKLS